MNTWSELWRAHFSKLSDEDVAVWEEELLRDIRDLQQSEIVEAVRKLSWDDRKFTPKLKDLRIAIYVARKGERRDNDPPTPSCAHCMNGWVQYYPAYPDANQEEPLPEKFWIDHGVDVPCACTAGQEVMEMVYDSISQEKREELRAQAKVAINQNVWRLKQETEISADIGGIEGFNRLKGKIGHPKEQAA